MSLIEYRLEEQVAVVTMKSVTFKNILRIMETDDPAHLEALRGSFFR